ncbi:MAG: TetR/AcrR family transcriptional regulator, partial [Phenylobacterium sp.]
FYTVVYSELMVKPPLSPKRQRTRAALVEATLAIIAERGIAAVSLDEIAARAGVTKGAIYSNYRNKGELLWEAVDRRRPHLTPEAKPGDPMAQARAIARAIMAALPDAEREAAFHSELQVYIRTDPELRARQAEQQKAQLDDIARQITEGFGDRLAMPPRTVALAVQALILGFTTQWERTPEEVTEDLVTAAFEALAIGAASPR